MLVFFILPCVFGGAFSLLFYDIEKNVLLTLAVVIFFSHNITTSLCCSVDCFILVIVISRYDCKPTLNIVVKKLLWLVLINHESISESSHSKPPLFFVFENNFPPTSYSSVPWIFACHSKSFNDVYKMLM